MLYRLNVVLAGVAMAVALPRLAGAGGDQALRARGIGQQAALRQLGNRLVGILRGCLKTGTSYNETTARSHLNRPGLVEAPPNPVRFSIRHWIEQGYKQVKDELGWADFQVRSDTAIRRHQTLVNCAFSFGWDTWFDDQSTIDTPEPACDAGAVTRRRVAQVCTAVALARGPCGRCCGGRCLRLAVWWRSAA
jgi:hypothetical protein